MKRILKYILLTLAIFVAVSLSQATTLRGVVQLDKAFLKGVTSIPKAWFGKTIFWKYALVAIGLLGLFLEVIKIPLRKIFKRRKWKKRTKSSLRVKGVKEASLGIVKDPNSSATVVRSSEATTANQGRFKRVIPKK